MTAASNSDARKRQAASGDVETLDPGTEAEGWASYAAEQARHAETRAALADLRTRVKTLADRLQQRGEEATVRRSYSEGVEKKHAAGLVRALLAETTEGDAR